MNAQFFDNHGAYLWTWYMNYQRPLEGDFLDIEIFEHWLEPA